MEILFDWFSFCSGMRHRNAVNIKVTLLTIRIQFIGLICGIRANYSLILT